MGLATYAAECRRLIEELKDSLSEEDIQQLRRGCASVGFDGWSRWCGQNHRHVKAYISAAPSRRKKKKAWQEPGLQPYLTLAAIQQIQRSKALLEILSTRELPVGARYRDMAAEAGDMYVELVIYDLQAWPFPGPSPFDEER